MKKVVAKVRFNTSKEYFEKLGADSYLIYIPFEEDDDSHKVIASILSKKLGVVPTRMEFSGKDIRGNFVFEML